MKVVRRGGTLLAYSSLILVGFHPVVRYFP